MLEKELKKKKMIEWNILHQDDLYRKIVNDNNDIIGYIGYDDASLKENTRKFATLMIYIWKFIYILTILIKD